MDHQNLDDRPVDNELSRPTSDIMDPVLCDFAVSGVNEAQEGPKGKERGTNHRRSCFYCLFSLTIRRQFALIFYLVYYVRCRDHAVVKGTHPLIHKATCEKKTKRPMLMQLKVNCSASKSNNYLVTPSNSQQSKVDQN